MNGLVFMVMWSAISLAVSWLRGPQAFPMPSWFIPNLKPRMRRRHVEVVQPDGKHRRAGLGLANAQQLASEGFLPRDQSSWRSPPPHTRPCSLSHHWVASPYKVLDAWKRKTDGPADRRALVGILQRYLGLYLARPVSSIRHLWEPEITQHSGWWTIRDSIRRWWADVRGSRV